jgi:hypothetical protein
MSDGWKAFWSFAVIFAAAYDLERTFVPDIVPVGFCEPAATPLGGGCGFRLACDRVDVRQCGNRRAASHLRCLGDA